MQQQHPCEILFKEEDRRAQDQYQYWGIVKVESKKPAQSAMQRKLNKNINEGLISLRAKRYRV